MQNREKLEAIKERAEQQLKEAKKELRRLEREEKKRLEREEHERELAEAWRFYRFAKSVMVNLNTSQGERIEKLGYDYLIGKTLPDGRTYNDFK